MYADDISDKDSEFEERSPEDSPSVTKKSVSTVGFKSSAERAGARPLALRATQSFTGAVEELRLCAPLQRVTVSRTPGGGAAAGRACPCGCLLRAPVPAAFRTRDLRSHALHVVPPDVLHYHGYSFEPAMIAMFWKKDCRKFLWKGRARDRTALDDDAMLKLVL